MTLAEPLVLHTHRLRGCHPGSLLAYLKALGVVRLVGQQADSQVTAWWDQEELRISTRLSAAELVAFFLDDYAPTPILNPWNNGGGFLGSKGDVADVLLHAQDSRFAVYQETITAARRVIADLGIGDEMSKQEKEDLLAACRAYFPDAALDWLDAVYVLTADSTNFTPLLGSGGNDGNMDFGINFMQRLIECTGLITSKRPGKGDALATSRANLAYALFGFGAAAGPVRLTPGTPGQFHPGGAGGANATQGMEGEALTNPWDFVLAMEGAVLFGGAVARRLGAKGKERAAFPFTVNPVGAGYSTATSADSSTARAEVWLPLWTRPATAREITHMFMEGRAQWGKRQARTPLDFARAAVGLGVDRGLSAFARVGLLQRNGRSFLAAPLHRQPVVARPEVHLLHDLQLEPWLDRLRNLVNKDQAPARLVAAHRNLDEAMLQFCAAGDNAGLLPVFLAVGRAERALAATSPKLRKDHRPLQGLHADWIQHCPPDPEFRIAQALAGIQAGTRADRIPELRAYLEPVSWHKGSWQWNDTSRSNIWSEGPLTRNLAAVLRRRAVEAQMVTLGHLPLFSSAAAHVADVHAFLLGELDEDRIVDLLHALVCVEPSAPAREPGPADRLAALPRPYAILKLLHLQTDQKGKGVLRTSTGRQVAVPYSHPVLNLLLGGQVDAACQLTLRRLHASGLSLRVPATADGWLYAGGAERLAAALLIPVDREPALARLVVTMSNERQ